MSIPSKEQLLSDIAQFLEDEQEIYGSFAFTADEEEKILRRIESEADAAAEESAEKGVETILKTEEKARGEMAPEAESESETISEKTPESEEFGLMNPEAKAEGGIISEAVSEGEGIMIPESEGVSEKILETTDQSISEEEPETSRVITLKEKLEACQDLDQLRLLCEEADELRTDLEGTNLVFGVGNPRADLMLIGEAPGEQEEKEGEPFVGAAGQLLNKILAAIDFKREEVYIANILKHRPPGNRNPSPEERLRSLPYLLRQIDLIQPKLILCLGKVSGTTLLDREDTLKNLRGEFYPFRNTLLTVTYHPAALLRNPQWKRPVWEDVQKVKKKVTELSEGK